MITLELDPLELGEALYLAHISAKLLDNPHSAPATVWWDELSESEQQQWNRTARRLLEIHKVG